MGSQWDRDVGKGEDVGIRNIEFLKNFDQDLQPLKYMTVAELQRQLSKFDGENRVFISDGDYFFHLKIETDSNLPDGVIILIKNGIC